MKSRAIEIKVKSLKHQSLRTPFARYNLTKGEVFVGKFGSKEQLNSLIEMQIVQLVPEHEKVVKPVSIILPENLGDSLPLTSLPEEESTVLESLIKQTERTLPYSRAEMDELLAE
jgi:hypothetical protein